MRLAIKRVYLEPDPSDGFRILVDRLWPRGLSKKRATVDLWLKDIAPSTELRQWFHHDPAKWIQFQKRYEQELKSTGEQLDIIREKLHHGPVTLLYGAKDEEHNEAVVLLAILKPR